MLTTTERLPFAKKGNRKTPSSFWAVSGSGDYAVDCAMGKHYADMFEHVAMSSNHCPVLQNIVMDMVAHYGGVIPATDRGLIVGMFSEIEGNLVKHKAITESLTAYGLIRYNAKNESDKEGKGND